MQNYKIIKRIADGAFGTVYQAEVLNSLGCQDMPKIVALKQVYNSTNLTRELAILKKLPLHPHLIRTFGSFAENFRTVIVMERAKYDLVHWMNTMAYPIKEIFVKNIARQVLKGLQCLHSIGIVHRDLKPSNLVVKDPQTIAICDFGSAVECSKGEQYELEGFTRWYKPPQMLFGSRTYGYQADIWSLGCILMQIASGEPLFNGCSQIEQLALISNLLGDPSPQHWPSVVKLPDYQKINFNKNDPVSIEVIAKDRAISDELCRFIFLMVRYDKRPSASELIVDPYLKSSFETGDFLFQGRQFELRKQWLEKGKLK